MKILYTVNEPDIEEFSYHHSLQQKGYRDRLVRHKYTWPGVLIIAALYAFFFSNNIYLALGSAVAGILWGIYIPKLIMNKQAEEAVNAIKSQEGNTVFGDHSLVIEKKQLLGIFNGQEKSMAWKSLHRVEKTELHAFIYTGQHAALVVPKQSVKEGSFDDFIAQVEKNIID